MDNLSHNVIGRYCYEYIDTPCHFNYLEAYAEADALYAGYGGCMQISHSLSNCIAETQVAIHYTVTKSGDVVVGQSNSDLSDRLRYRKVAVRNRSIYTVPFTYWELDHRLILKSIDFYLSEYERRHCCND
jgi:hypothetical protein